MNIQDLGNLGELIAAIATVATLFYLAIQIRQSAAATKAQVRQKIAEQQINYLHIRASDPIIRPALAKMMRGETLNTEDATTMRLHAIAGFRAWESNHAQHLMGTISDEDWRALSETMRFHLGYAPYQEAFFLMGDSLNREFREFIEQFFDTSQWAGARPLNLM